MAEHVEQLPDATDLTYERALALVALHLGGTPLDHRAEARELVNRAVATMGGSPSSYTGLRWLQGQGVRWDEWTGKRDKVGRPAPDLDDATVTWLEGQTVSPEAAEVIRWLREAERLVAAMRKLASPWLRAG